jgi:putrescine aminotransferase
MEFVSDEMGYQLASGLFAKGVMTAGTLTNAKCIRFEPALTIPMETMDKALTIMEEVIKEIKA